MKDGLSTNKTWWIIMFVVLWVVCGLFLLLPITLIIVFIFGNETLRAPGLVSQLAVVGSILGCSISVATVAIAISIYRFQRKELNDGLRENLTQLQHLAVSLKKLNGINGIKEALNEADSWIENGNVTHALIISRYSAIPAFWINESLSLQMMAVVRKAPNKLFIGPHLDVFSKDALDVATFITREENLRLLSEEQQSELQRRWLKNVPAYEPNIIQEKILEEYRNNLAPIGQNLAESKLIESMGVNAIILKCKEPPNKYDCVFEIFFFGPQRSHDSRIPEQLIFPEIYSFRYQFDLCDVSEGHGVFKLVESTG